MDCLPATQQYYANWLSVAPDLLGQHIKLCIYSPERDRSQVGHSRPFDLYGYFSAEATILTYGQKLNQQSEWLWNLLRNHSAPEEFIESAQEQLGRRLQHSYKYYFRGLPAGIDFSRARQLTIEDYPAFLRFFKAQYPDKEPETWLADYFANIAQKGYVFGLFADNELVCASDAPDVPYLQEIIVELGINTLVHQRCKGYAKIVLGATTNFLVCNSKTPIVSCASSNTASQKLIQSVGFVKFADVVSLSFS